MLFTDPFEALFNLQRELDAFRESDWLESGPSGIGPYPPLNVFRKGDDYVILTEVPGIKKSDLDVQVKNGAIRIAGKKTVDYPEKASLHRRERHGGEFDRTITMPVQIDEDHVRAEYHDGILALYLPRSQADKPKPIKIH